MRKWLGLLQVINSTILQLPKVAHQRPKWETLQWLVVYVGLSLGRGYLYFLLVVNLVYCKDLIEALDWSINTKLRPRLEEHKLTAGDCELFQIWSILLFSFIHSVTYRMHLYFKHRAVLCEILKPWVRGSRQFSWSEISITWNQIEKLLSKTMNSRTFAPSFYSTVGELKLCSFLIIAVIFSGEILLYYIWIIVSTFAH